MEEARSHCVDWVGSARAVNGTMPMKHVALRNLLGTPIEVRQPAGGATECTTRTTSPPSVALKRGTQNAADVPRYFR
jgi:hypothetical protein